MLYVSSYSDYMFMNFLNVGCGHVYLVSIYSLHCMSLTIYEYSGAILLLNMFVCFQKKRYQISTSQIPKFYGHALRIKHLPCKFLEIESTSVILKIVLSKATEVAT